MVSVDKVYKGVQYLANKSQRGGYISPLEFNREAPTAFYELINSWTTSLSELRYDAPQPIQGFEQTQRNSDALSDIIETVSLSPVNGQVTKPSDYMHMMRIYSTSTYTVDDTQFNEEVEVEEVIKPALTGRLNSLVQPVDKAHPIYATYADYFKVYPTDIALVHLDYIRQPLAPIWDYDTSSGVPVFAAAGATITTNTTDPVTGETVSVPRNSQSQDFEIGEEELPTVINAVCKRLAINIREADLFQYVEALKQSN